MVIFEFTSIALRCLDKSFTLMEMVREMNIFANSGTAGIDLSSLQTNYQGCLGAVIINGKLVLMRAHINLPYFSI